MYASPVTAQILIGPAAASWQKLLRGKPGEEQFANSASAIAPNVLDRVSLSDNGVQQGLMASNFTTANHQQSKYVSAQLQSLSSTKEVLLQGKSFMTELLNQFGGLTLPSCWEPDGNRKGMGTSEAEIQRALRRRAAKKILEAAKEDLKQAKKQIEEKAQEALTHRDVKGNPLLDDIVLAESVQVVPTADTSAVDTPAADAGRVAGTEVVSASTAYVALVPAGYVSSPASVVQAYSKGRSLDIKV